MYLAMISIYNTLIEKLYKLDKKTNNSPFRSNVKVSQS